MADSLSFGSEIQEDWAPTKLNTWRLVRDKAWITPEVFSHRLPGSGTESDPYLVEWLPNDLRNPMNFSQRRKWTLAWIGAFTVFGVSFSSSGDTGAIPGQMAEWGLSNILALLPISFFVLGFAIGPVFWAPLSEIYGRQAIFLITYGMYTIFDAGCIGAQSITQLVVLRFIAGLCGSAQLTNAGGVIADMFSAAERGKAQSVFAAAPFMGPVLGPVVGGYLGLPISWRWIHVLITCLATCLFLAGASVPETYAPVLLQHRAKVLSKRTGKVYVTRLDHLQGPKSLSAILKIVLARPWVLLFKEPVVLIMSTYMAIFYGTMYMFFGAFPIVFEELRGWSQGVSGLTFFGQTVGMTFALLYMRWENTRYVKIADASPHGRAPAEARLLPCMIAAVATPIGLFMFAWTNGKTMPWILPVIGSGIFGFGNVLLSLGCVNYLIDAYVIYAASVMAANAIIRSVLGATFPLFTATMYKHLGIHWASSIPAFLALMCMPFPFVFARYGAAIRKRCKYAAEAQKALDEMLKTSGGEGENVTDLELLEEEAKLDLEKRTTVKTVHAIAV